MFPIGGVLSEVLSVGGMRADGLYSRKLNLGAKTWETMPFDLRIFEGIFQKVTLYFETNLDIRE